MTCWHQRSTQYTLFRSGCPAWLNVHPKPRQGFCQLAWNPVSLRPQCLVTAPSLCEPVPPYTLQDPMTTNVWLSVAGRRTNLRQFSGLTDRIFGLGWGLRECSVIVTPPPSSAIAFKTPWTGLLAVGSDANAQPPGLGSHPIESNHPQNGPQRFKTRSQYKSTQIIVKLVSIDLVRTSLRTRSLQARDRKYSQLDISIPANLRHSRWRPKAESICSGLSPPVLVLGRASSDGMIVEIPADRDVSPAKLPPRVLKNLNSISLCPTTRSLESDKYGISRASRDTALRVDVDPRRYRELDLSPAQEGVCAYFIQYPTCFALEEIRSFDTPARGHISAARHCDSNPSFKLANQIAPSFDAYISQAQRVPFTSKTPPFRTLRYGYNTGFESRLEFYSFNKIPAAIPPSCSARLESSLVTTRRAVYSAAQHPSRLQLDLVQTLLAGVTQLHSVLLLLLGVNQTHLWIDRECCRVAGRSERPPPPERAESESGSESRKKNVQGEGANTVQYSTVHGGFMLGCALGAGLDSLVPGWYVGWCMGMWYTRDEGEGRGRSVGRDMMHEVASVLILRLRFKCASREAWRSLSVVRELDKYGRDEDTRCTGSIIRSKDGLGGKTNWMESLR
ncbi:hypothetical protein C8R43DRAFT_959043 [Mycena crocata]|nr:hypothetical protein C8R43DRAFT_959043 [Mycena crocata]